MSGILRKRHLENSSSDNIKLIKIVQTAKENIPPRINEIINPDDNKTCFREVKTVITTPKKSRENLEEPVTPSTNFKLLTSLAAALEYVVTPCVTPKCDKSCEALDNQMCDSDISDLSAGKVNRKDKSLALICTRFLEMYPLYPSADTKIIVSLDEAGLKLGVERRRLYDIVNVFESIDILSKNAKNQYLWFGKNNLVKSLYKLKATAIKENLLEKLQYVLQTECAPNCKLSCILDEVQNFNKTLENQDSTVLSTQISSPEVRREKSLGIMSQKFLMLFLVSPNKIISLGVAAKVLNSFVQRNEKGTKVKTQIRRLYDIANVLTSIRLIQKETASSQSKRKPAFKYIGPDLKDFKGDFSDMDRPIPQRAMKSEKRSLVRHASFQEICAAAEIERQKLNLEESHNSAPPFESAFINKENNVKTNFENLQLNDRTIKSTKINMDTVEIKPEVKTPVIVKPNVKFINIAKSVASPAVPCYVLNNVSVEKSDIKHTNSGYGTQTFLLINTIAPSKEMKIEIAENKPILRVRSPQTIALSSQQRDAILQSLNISLSSEQTAAIHLDGASQSNNSDAPSNVLKILNKNNTPRASENKNVVRVTTLLKDFEINTNGLTSVNNTRSNSPSSTHALDSPFSIPSGYVTPIPNVSSDISFVSSVEVNDILKKIESQSNFDALNSKITTNQENGVYHPTTTNTKIKAMEHVSTSLQDSDTKEKLACNNYPVNNSLNNESYSTNQVSQLISNDSCSSDSVNLEVSNIFKGKNFRDALVKPKPFLIDEKTLLSPIKAPNALGQISVSSSLLTPPCIVPETAFVFSAPPVSYQTTVNGISSLITSVPNPFPENKKDFSLTQI